MSISKQLNTERKEWDILRDVIADMQEEIDQLKETVSKVNTVTGIASWFVNSTFAGNALSFKSTFDRIHKS